MKKNPKLEERRKKIRMKEMETMCPMEKLGQRIEATIKNNENTQNK